MLKQKLMRELIKSLMNYKKLLLIFIIATTNLFCTTSAQYWEQIKSKADKLYKGIDMNFSLNLSFADYDDSEENKGGKISLKVPIYSSSAKRAKEDEKRSFLEKGAGFIKEFEVNTRLIVILEEQIRLKKAIMYEEGAAGIEAFIKLESSLAEAKSNLKEAERKLEVMLKY